MKNPLVYKKLSFQLLITLFLCGIALPTVAATKTATISIDSINSLYELKFYTAFFSMYPNYPHSKNIQRGRVHIKQTENGKTVFAKNLFEPAPLFLKKVITAKSANNNFAKIYDFYKNKNDFKSILKCPALSTAFELDNDKSTKEWIVSLSLKFCLSPERGVDQYPHMWLIQKTEDGEYLVLLESDDSITITHEDNTDLGYKVVKSDIFLNRLSTKNSKKCGGATVSWSYIADRYRPTQREYHHVDCDTGKSTGVTLQKYSEKHLDAIRPQIDEIITSLAFNTGTLTTKVIKKSKKKRSPRQKYSSQAKGILDLISKKELQELLK